jgi:hypothetical protein
MALGLNVESKSSGDILPILKFNTQTGEFIRQDRFQDASGAWTKSEEEVKLPLKFAADFENMEVGWLSFGSGHPDFAMTRIGGEMPDRPSPEHKQAFRVRLTNKDLGLRELSGSSKTLLRAMDSLHDEYVSQTAANPGKFAVVAVTELETVHQEVRGEPRRYKSPVWHIESWMDTPKVFQEGAEPEPAPYSGEPAMSEGGSEDDADLF